MRSVCIIGAGSSGLVAAKHLRDAGFQVTILERSRAIGGAFVSKAYDDSRLVSSTYLTAFSDLRCTSAHKPHMLLTEYTQYLEVCRGSQVRSRAEKRAAPLHELIRAPAMAGGRWLAASAALRSLGAADQPRVDLAAALCTSAH